MSTGDAERLRMGYAAFNHGGIEAILESLDPQIHVRERETMPDAATYHGRTGVRSLFTTMLEAFDDLQYEVEEIVDRGDRSVVVLRQLVRGRGSGISMGAETVHVWEMHEGRPVSLTIFGTREQALASLDPGLRPR
jgi:ketosteroid isomerase-like protein